MAGFPFDGFQVAGRDSAVPVIYTLSGSTALEVGDMVADVGGGLCTRAASNGTNWAGPAITDAAADGDPVTVMVMTSGTRLNVIDSGTRMPGALLDLNATGDGVTTASNNDFEVVEDRGGYTVVVPKPARYVRY